MNVNEEMLLTEAIKKVVSELGITDDLTIRVNRTFLNIEIIPYNDHDRETIETIKKEAYENGRAIGYNSGFSAGYDEGFEDSGGYS